MAWGNSMGGNYAAPILDQINRTGDLMQYGDQARRRDELLAMQKQQNAFQQQMQGLQMEEAKQAQVEKVRHQNAFAKAYPLADPSQDPQGFARLYVQNGGNPEIAMKVLADSQKGYLKLGENESLINPRSGEVVIKGAGGGLTGDAKNLATILGRTPTMEDLMRLKQSGAMNITPYQQESLRVRQEGQQQTLDARKDYQQEQMDFKKSLKDEDRQVKMAKDKNLIRSVEYDLSSVDKIVDDLTASEGLQNLTGYTGRVPFTIRQSSVDAQAMLERLKSNLMINVLQGLKTASANGSSGFGALNQTEGEAIKTKLAALKEAQSYDQIIKELNGIKEWTANLRKNMKQTFEETWAGRQPGESVKTGSAYKSPDDVKAAFQAGKITKTEAAGILTQQFGME